MEPRVPQLLSRTSCDYTLAESQWSWLRAAVPQTGQSTWSLRCAPDQPIPPALDALHVEAKRKRGQLMVGGHRWFWLEKAV